MSSINIERAVENIRPGKTDVYAPLVEIIVNAIDAIETAKPEKGRVDIRIKRSVQQVLGDDLPGVEGFMVIDNGIGFNDENRASFDTLYSEHKIAQGAKGFGRFICLKYFNDLAIDSVFENAEGRHKRTFRMGRETEIIVNEQIVPCPDGNIGSRVTLCNVKRAFPERKIETIARKLVERLLPYFIDKGYQCPEIGIAEEDGNGQIILNDFIHQRSSMIEEVPVQNGDIALGPELGPGDTKQRFQVRVFKLYAPGNQKSKIIMAAHRRKVTNTAIAKLVPEFEEAFVEPASAGARGRVEPIIS